MTCRYISITNTVTSGEQIKNTINDQIKTDDNYTQHNLLRIGNTASFIINFQQNNKFGLFEAKYNF